MAGFKSPIARMNQEQLTAAVIKQLAAQAGCTGLTMLICDGGNFTGVDVDRVTAVVTKLLNPAYALRAARGMKRGTKDALTALRCDHAVARLQDCVRAHQQGDTPKSAEAFRAARSFLFTIGKLKETKRG